MKYRIIKHYPIITQNTTHYIYIVILISIMDKGSMFQ